MKIEASCIRPPISLRCFDWSAIDLDTYDGAPDSGRLARIQGFGRMKEKAVCDLLERLDEEFDAGVFPQYSRTSSKVIRYLIDNGIARREHFPFAILDEEDAQ